MISLKNLPYDIMDLGGYQEGSVTMISYMLYSIFNYYIVIMIVYDVVYDIKII
jgi:hypothetical protein